MTSLEDIRPARQRKPGQGATRLRQGGTADPAPSLQRKYASRHSSSAASCSCESCPSAPRNRPFLTCRMPGITGDYQQTGIAGSSYRAVTALHTLIQHPKKFGLAILECFSFQVGNGQYLRDTEHLIECGRRIALGVGTMETGGANPDVDKAWIKAVEQLAENLRCAALPPKIKLVAEEDGRHGGAAFARRLPNDLVFLFGPEPKPETAR